MAGLTILSISHLFIENNKNKGKLENNGFLPKNIASDVRKYWWLLLLPIVSGIKSIGLYKLIVPDFYLHVLERAKSILSMVLSAEKAG
jgi:hypothetical protein